MNATLLKVLLALVQPQKIVPALLAAAASGSLGAAVRRLYWIIAGKKTYIMAGVSALVAFFLELEAYPAECAAMNCSFWLETLKVWGPLLLGSIALGSIDDALRTEAPRKE